MAQRNESDPDDPPPAAASLIARRRLLLALGAMSVGPAVFAGCAVGRSAGGAAPSVAGNAATQRRVHGTVLRDPFGWVDAASLDDPAIVAWLTRNQRESDALMAPLASRVQTLRGERAAAEPPAETPVPVADGDAEYWTEWSSGHRRLLRRRRGSGAVEVLLDADDTRGSAGKARDFVAWGVSPAADLVAFAVVDSPEHHLLRIKDLETGRLLADALRDVGVQITSERIVWTADGRGIVYGEVDAAGRPWRARLHRLGSPQAVDAVLHREDDPAFFVEIRQTTSRRFALIHSVSIDTSEVRLLDRTRLGAPRLVSPRQPGRLYTIDEAAGELAILTNDTHPNFRLVAADPSAPGEWRELIAADPRAGMQWHQAFSRHIAIAERHEGSSRVRVLDRATGAIATVEFPEPVCAAGFDRWTAGPEANREADADRLRLGMVTFTRPKALYDYRFSDGTLTLLQTRTPPSRRYVVERLQAIADDGVAIPMSVVRPRQGALRGAVLYGYGAYGVPSDPEFDPQRFSLLDRGVAYVIAHVRGGGDLGGAWHEAGRGARRGKPIEDFLACARALVASGFAARGRIACMGRSAGGWLAGAAVNRDPGLWAAMVADVPFVDVLTQLLKPGEAMTAAERSETGDVVADAAAFARVLRLCPYRNIATGTLPPVYLTASLADVRVPWTGPLKYAARLRAAAPGNKVVLRFDRGGNHWGPSSPETGEVWAAERVAFILDALQIRA